MYWRLSSVPAIFGQDIVLTCYLEDISTNPKDCPVRQWSGGPKRKGLVYNGYSSDNNKYMEYANRDSFQYSLIIRHLAESDINVNYTCTCGFHTSTKNLSLDENTFHYPPTGINDTFSVEDNWLHVSLYLEKVFPVPNCSLYLGNSLILKKVPVTYKNNGLFYCVMYNTSYKLKEKDCNKQPELRCTFNPVAESVIIKGTEAYYCSGYKSNTIHLLNATTTNNDNEDPLTTKLSTWQIALIGVSVILISCISIAICCYTTNHKKRFQSKHEYLEKGETINLM